MGGRALFFVYPSWRKIIKEKFVPVVHSCVRLSGYESDDKFWEQLGKQGAYLGNSIGVVCTASGKLLSGKEGDLEQALEVWNKLPESERKPGAVQIEDRGPFNPKKGVQPPPGALILRVFIRDLKRDGKDQLYAPRKQGDLMAGGVRFEILEEPNRDFLWMTDAEAKALAPKSSHKGEKIAFPKALQERIFRFHLCDHAKGVAGPWDAADLRSGELTLTVEDVVKDVARMRLDGSVFLGDKTKSLSYLDGRLLGRVDYDVKAKAFKKFDVVCLADFKGMRGVGEKAGRVRADLGFAFELFDEKSSANRVPPIAASIPTAFDDYFKGASGTLRASASRSAR